MLRARLLLLCSCLALAGAETAPATRASLHADHRSLPAGGSGALLVRVEPPPGWHVYWQNPGDSGLPTSLRWTLAAGLRLGTTRWPLPQRFEAAGLVSFGYERELLLEIPFELAPDLPPGPLRLEATVAWLACQEACVPGRAELALELQVGAQAEPDPSGADLLARARAAQPDDQPPWRFSVQRRPGELVLDLHPLAATAPRPATLSFLPATEGVIALAGVQRWQPHPLPQLVLPLEPGGELPPRLEGLLVAEDPDGRRAWSVALPLASGGDP